MQVRGGQIWHVEGEKMMTTMLVAARAVSNDLVFCHWHLHILTSTLTRCISVGCKIA